MCSYIAPRVSEHSDGNEMPIDKPYVIEITALDELFWFAWYVVVRV
jgi:hypothetical protein